MVISENRRIVSVLFFLREKKMLKIAFYGKGGIGKSTTVSNLAAIFAKMGLKVMQIGCDPKADSTSVHHGGKRMGTVLDLIRKYNDDFSLEDMVLKGDDNVLCVEAGGPVPGMGCAGRGIIAALEKLEQKGAYEVCKPDIVLYDVLGDVVCGGFSMPMRKGYAHEVYIVTSGEKMSIYAAGNIAMAVDLFRKRSYAELGGFILNCRDVPDEEKNVKVLAEDFHSSIAGRIGRSRDIQEAERLNKCVCEAFPDSPAAKEYTLLAENILKKWGIKAKC